MQGSSVRRVAVLLALTWLSTTSALAQITTATVAGTVRDAQGAAVPGASVTLISETRGTQLADVSTNATGDFVFPNVTGDTYTVQVTLQGFKTLKRGGILVSPGDRVAVSPEGPPPAGRASAAPARTTS